MAYDNKPGDNRASLNPGERPCQSALAFHRSCHAQLAGVERGLSGEEGGEGEKEGGGPVVKRRTVFQEGQRGRGVSARRSGAELAAS